ncbi:hypothetical protein ACEWY4_011397 [Coilia grayii]|uniref:Uncharacterized protein n=1 Tax=Coilia grayii TaxID=363190 RepID=A0ABD1K4M4_9TELE
MGESWRYYAEPMSPRAQVCVPPPTGAVLCCAVLRCAALCCAVLRCAALCCAVLRCAALCCAPVYQHQGRSEEAVARCERALEQQGEMDKAGRTCSIYREMASIEQARGRLDKATEHLLQAHAIALRQSPGGAEGARVAHSLALAYSTAAEPHHNDSAVHYFEESLSAYRSVVGPEDAMTLSVLDDYSCFLLQTGQQERSVGLQREALALKRSTFGDLSAEVAQALQLIAGVEMTQGYIKKAHRTMSQTDGSRGGFFRQSRELGFLQCVAEGADP